MQKLVFIILVLVLATVGGGFYFYTVRGATAPANVVAQPFSRGEIVDAVGATGTLEAVETVDVGTQVSGVVAALYADFNAIVRKGQVIARLDPQLIETQIDQQAASVARAEAEVERLKVGLADARQKLERARMLTERNLVPRTELEAAEVNVKLSEAQIRSAEASLTQARAQLENSRVNLNYTTIKAPIDGIVISRNVDRGQTVAASMNAPTLYVIAADLTRMQVVANIDESDVGRMRPGQQVTFRVDAFPSDLFTGVVTQVRLQPSVVQNVVTYSTVIAVQNPELKLKPGMTANVSIEVARRSNVLRIPNAALRFRPTGPMFAALNQPVPPESGRTTPPSNAGARPASAPAAGESQIVLRKGDAGPGTIDALFGPIEMTESRGTAWLFDGRQLKMIGLRLGVTDGTLTEVLNGAEIAAHAQVVTSLTLGVQAQSTNRTRQTSPLMGPQPAGPGRSGTGTTRAVR